MFVLRYSKEPPRYLGKGGKIVSFFMDAIVFWSREQAELVAKMEGEEVEVVDVRD